MDKIIQNQSKYPDFPPILDKDCNPHRLECLTVSVGCAKMLGATLRYNVHQVDRMLVGTTKKDTETQEVCRKYGVDCFITDAFHRNGAKFDKGWAHEQMLKHLNWNQFVLFIDADIILHQNTRKYLCSQRLDTNRLYGADRIYVTKPIHIELMNRGQLCGPISANEWGFGHFQLFHMSSKYLAGKSVICRSNPTEKEPFGFDDYLFREQFGSNHVFVDGIWNWDTAAQSRMLLPCYHLGEASESAKSTGLIAKKEEPKKEEPPKQEPKKSGRFNNETDNLGKIALLTHYTKSDHGDYSQIAALTIPNRDEWCNRHGYKHIIQSGFHKRPDWYYAYDRLLLIRDTLDRPDAPDILWVLNVQAVITNLGKKLEEVLDDEHDFWMTKDTNGISMGSFVIRNTEWSKKWIDFLISVHDQYTDRQHEQSAAEEHWMKREWLHKIGILPQRAINSYFYPIYPPWTHETPGSWKKGDLVVNIPSYTIEQRLSIIQSVLGSNLIVK